MGLFDLDLFDDIVFETMGAPVIAGVGYYLNNYHPLDYHPDNYWSKWQVPIVPVAAGGSGMHRQRQYWDAWELQRIKEDEELILLMAAWLA